MASSPQEMTCPDQHVCRNGAMCIKDPEKEGRYKCDCDAAADPDSVYAGLSCEHIATEYCNWEGRTSQKSFCTNGGTCIQNVEAIDGKHLGCICTSAYTGDHCEFIKMLGPGGSGSSSGRDSSISGTSATSAGADDGPSSAVKISLSLIGVILIASTLIVLFIVHRARYGHQKTTRKPSDTDLQLEADGETMKDVNAVIHGGKTKKSSSKQPESPPAVATQGTSLSQDDAESVEAGVI